jgi:2-phospho-L-lactate guanylyltransferase
LNKNRKFVVAIIPVREFKNTKLRMGNSLSSRERSALTISLLCHVLGQLESSQVEKVVIVASDKKTVQRISRRFMKSIVITERVHHAGVNNAMKDGIAYSETNFPEVTSLMLIPSDLPLLSDLVINEAIAKLDNEELVICPSARLDGTSLLLFNFPKGSIPFHYDNDSYRQHLREARKRKLRYSIFKRKEFSFDVDTMGDLQKLKRILNVKSSEELFKKLQLP